MIADSPGLYSAAVKQQSRTSATPPCNFTNDVVVGDITVAMIQYSSVTWAVSNIKKWLRLHDFILRCFNFYIVLILRNWYINAHLWSCTFQWLALIFLSNLAQDTVPSLGPTQLDDNRVVDVQLIQVNGKWNILWAVCFGQSPLYTLKKFALLWSYIFWFPQREHCCNLQITHIPKLNMICYLHSSVLNKPTSVLTLK